MRSTSVYQYAQQNWNNTGRWTVTALGATCCTEPNNLLTEAASCQQRWKDSSGCVVLSTRHQGMSRYTPVPTTGARARFYSARDRPGYARDWRNSSTRWKAASHPSRLIHQGRASAFLTEIKILLIVTAYHQSVRHWQAGASEKNRYCAQRRKDNSMSDQDPSDSGDVPMMQKLLDNPFLLLFIGVASPSILYLVWGIMEIITIPAR